MFPMQVALNYIIIISILFIVRATHLGSPLSDFFIIETRTWCYID